MSENKKYFTDESLATLIGEIKNYTDEAISEISFLDVNEDGVLVGKANPINADTLNGQLPDYYATAEQLAELDEKISNQTSVEHNHDDRYYTETEIDEKFENLTQNISDKFGKDGDGNVITDTYVTVDGANVLYQLIGIKTSNLKVEIEQDLQSNYTTKDELSTAIENLTAADIGALPDTTVIPSIAGLASTEYVDGQLKTKADSEHAHDALYDAIGSASASLEEAKAYIDDALAKNTQVQIITWGADD